MYSNIRTAWMDTAGAFASWLCVVHCLFLPLMVGVLPLVGLSFLLSESTEKIILLLSFAIALASIIPAFFSRHRSILPAILVFSGLGAILISQTFLEDSIVMAAIVLITSASMITAGHLLNRRLCRSCEDC